MMKNTALGLVIAASLFGGLAQAKPGKPVTPPEAHADGSGLPTAGSFSQSFELVAASASLYTITVGGLAELFGNSASNLSFTFEGVTTGSSANGGNIAGQYSLSGLTAGSPYTLVVNGVSSVGKATYTVSATGFSSVTPSAPVPEPESYAMLLAGLGVMATIARRRRGTHA